MSLQSTESGWVVIQASFENTPNGVVKIPQIVDPAPRLQMRTVRQRKRTERIMDPATFAAIAFASAINSAMPGPCVAMNIARSARNGLSAGFAVTLGAILAKIGLTVVALLVIVGSLNDHPSLYAAMNVGGALILSVLAFRILFATRQARENRDALARRLHVDVAAGLSLGLFSPFNLVFLLVLLPQLTEGTRSETVTAAGIVTAVALGAAISSMAISVLGAGVVGKRSHLVRPLECAGALAMIGFAALGMTAHV